jgi:hypothetical protein
MIAKMSTSLSRLPLLLSSLLAIACGATTQTAAPRPVEPVPAQPGPPASAPPLDGLYAADEALRDALASPLEYVGTGDWPGINRMQACAFRNDRVLLVNVYCTLSEAHAFRIDVYSPRRGRVRIYAEAQGPISEHSRLTYFTFTAESEPPPGPETRVPPLSLGMSFEQLRRYDEQRYEAFLPACYGGMELSKPRSGCLGTLGPRVGEWQARHRVFLERASDDWYRVIREMRTLASRYGKEPSD